MANTHKVSFKLNGKARRRGGRAARAADPHAAREARAHRPAHRLRNLALRRLHGRRRRHVGQVLHRADGAVRRRRDAHRRRPRAGRRAARAAAGLSRGARPAVRLLHAGHDHARLPAAARRTRTRASRTSATASPATCAAAPATRTSSRRCSRLRKKLAAAPTADAPDAGTSHERIHRRHSMGDMSELQEREDKLQGMGTSLLRKEDAKFIRGQGTYVDDIKLPGMLFGAIVRSPYAHARIKGIDKSKALACPGVVAVLTADDLKPVNLHWMPTLGGDVQAVLADKKVLLPDAGSGDGAGHRPLRRRRRRRAGRGGLRGAAGDRRPEEVDGQGRADHPRGHRRQEGSRPRPAHAPEPHLHLGGRQQGRRRRGLRRAPRSRCARRSSTRACTPARWRPAAAWPRSTRPPAT